MKKLSFILIIVTLSLFFSTRLSYASTLFYDSISGTPGQSWIPQGWSIKSGPGIFSSDGAVGLFDYYRDFFQKNLTIKFDYNIHSNDNTNVLFACRANGSYSDVVQGFLDQNGFSHVDECNNVLPGQSCYRDLPPSGESDVPYDHSIGTHHIEFSCIDTSITEKEDGKVILQTTSNTNLSTGVRFNMSSGNNSVSNLEICDSTSCSSITPTPPPSLPVPLIKQYDLPSGSQVYDSADIWAHNNPYIATWGCALTSATMVLQYYGITTMSDNTPLIPATLNLWLKSQNDGYIGNGLVNWAAISRLTLLAKLAQNNPHLKVDALEYKRVNSADFTTLNSDLQNSQPDILQEPVHFVVATGTNGSTYTINDPYYNRLTLADGYGNTFSNIVRYVPSHTDLSYILVVTDPSIDILLKDIYGVTLGNEYTQDPLENDQDPGQVSGNPIKILEYTQPTDGTYSLTMSGSQGQSYSAKVYFYDNQGNVKVQQVTGKLQNPSVTYTLTFSKTNESTDNVSAGKSVTLLSNDLDMLFQYNFIDNGSYQSLSSVSQNAEKNMDNPLLAKTLLNVVLNLLRAKHGHGVSDLAFTILQADIQTLINSL